MKKRSIISAFLSLSVMTLFGCSGGGGGTGTTNPGPGASTDTTISGVAAKGPINGGTVKVFAIISSTGQADTTPLATGPTASDGSGSFSITIPAGKKPSGPVLLEVSGGTFDDEASAVKGVKLTTTLQAAVASLAAGENKIAVTPLTHLAVRQVKGIGAGLSAQEITDANKQIGKLFKVEDIIKSQPFDATKDARAGATADDKLYATALGVFSQLCDKRRGAKSLEDSLGTILDDLGTELETNGGFKDTTIIELNEAVSAFSGKNKGGATPTPITAANGVLQLSTAGTLPANKAIQGIDITITIPSGVTFGFDAATGEVAPGVVVPSSTAATGSFSTAKFDPATGKLHVALINIKPGMTTLGEFMHLEFAGTPPAADSFAVTVNNIAAGSTVDTTAALTDLTGVISITKTVAGI